MILSELRTRVIKETGRDDLVKGDGTDNGIDMFINASIRLLDMFQDNPKSRATHRENMVVGTSYYDIQYCRVVEEVWISTTTSATDSDTGRSLLDEKDLNWIKEQYPTIPVTDLEDGKPLYWAIYPAGLSPEFFSIANLAAMTGATHDLEGILFGSHSYKTQLLIVPPPDIVYTLEVVGKFFSKELLLATDYNYWTVRFPELVILTVSMLLEGMYRNSEGVNDWMRMVKMFLDPIEFDLVEQEARNVNNFSMRGR
uniref:Tail protein n=1 Tax=viral metagenome TaxID=1070528 RepID=A0A6M3KL68_9ZZZZ